MRRLLVTGGAGFIGTNFVHYWVGRYPQDRIVVLDALTYAGIRENLQPVEDHPGLRFVHGDIRDYDLVHELLVSEQLDTVVHFAAESHVDRSIHGPDAFIDTNIHGTHMLLKAAKAVWLDGGTGSPHRFHHVSTDEVYGTLTAEERPFSEINQYKPNSPYAASKASSDHLVRAYQETYDLQTTISNCSNNYGPYQFPEKLIPLMIAHILDGKSLPIYGDGLQIRDWLYVDDHNKGIELILDKGRAGEVYNIGGNNEWANIDIVKHICGLIDERFGEDASLRQRFPNSPLAHGSKAETLISHVEDRLGHDRRYAIDATKAEKELGYRPAGSFEDGIKKTLQWYFANEPWWRSIASSRLKVN